MGLGQLLHRQAQRTGQELRNANSTLELLFQNAMTDGEFPGSTYRGAMSIPAAWRAGIMLSDILGSVPWNAYRTIPGQPAELITPKPLLLEQPNPPDTDVVTFSSWALDLIHQGNAIGLIAARNAYGWPTAAYAIPSGMVYARRITEANKIWTTLPIGAIEYKVGQLTFGPNDVIHIKGPCEPGAVRGMGVLEYHMQSLTLAHEQIDQASDIARHGVPTAVLKSSNPDLTGPEAQKIKDKWQEARRSGGVAVLNASTDFEPLAWDPEKMQMMQARTFTNGEIALIYGVPARKLNGAESTSAMVYSNVEQESIDILRESCGGHLARFEAELSRHMPRGTFSKANLDARLRADTKTRYEAHQIGITAGFLLKSEARKKEDLPPVPGIDKPPPAPKPPAPPALPPGQEPPAVGSEDDQS